MWKLKPAHIISKTGSLINGEWFQLFARACFTVCWWILKLLLNCKSLSEFDTMHLKGCFCPPSKTVPELWFEHIYKLCSFQFERKVWNWNWPVITQIDLESLVNSLHFCQLWWSSNAKYSPNSMTFFWLSEALDIPFLARNLICLHS